MTDTDVATCGQFERIGRRHSVPKLRAGRDDLHYEGTNCATASASLAVALIRGLSSGVMIDGVLVHPLRRIADRRGEIMHMLRNDDPHFERFGEIYFSAVDPGVVKGWHLHTRMTLNYAVPTGRIRLVLYDDRPGSATRGRVQELTVGGDEYVLVRVPPGVWNGFLGLGPGRAVVANCATEPHDPNEIVRTSPWTRDIPYEWGDISPQSG